MGCLKKLGHILFLILLSLTISILSTQAEEVRKAAKKKILVVGTFPVEHTWGEGIHKGLVKALDKSSYVFDIFYETVDVSRLGAEYRKDLADFIIRKYKKNPPDYLVSGDAVSTQFLEDMVRPYLLQDKPFIFVAAHQTKADTDPGIDLLFSVADKPDYKNNLLTIKKLLPETQTIVFIGRCQQRDAIANMRKNVIPFAKKLFPNVTD